MNETKLLRSANKEEKITEKWGHCLEEVTWSRVWNP